MRRLGEKWALGVPTSLRGQLTTLRAAVEPDFSIACRLYAEAFDDLAGRDPAHAARVASIWEAPVSSGWDGWMRARSVCRCRGPGARGW